MIAFVFHGLLATAEVLGWALALAANATLICFLEVDGLGISYVAGGAVVDLFGRVCGGGWWVHNTCMHTMQ